MRINFFSIPRLFVFFSLSVPGLTALSSCSDDSSVTPVVCGDGIPAGGEECDDGNTEDGDGCSSECKVEASCPEEMVLIPANVSLGIQDPYCMDKYEASRPDATESDMGSDTSMAVSQPGVIPWHVNPMDPEALNTFGQACVAAGKRICTKLEWVGSCKGRDDTRYAFGDTFDPLICNCVDTYCADYCAAHPEIENCTTDANCGYVHDCFEVAPTGDFADCQSPDGAFDLNGNVWEVVPSYDDARGYEVRGGAYNCAGAEERLACGFNATWSSLYAGFRCCKDAY